MRIRLESKLQLAAWDFTRLSIASRYSYHFKWLGVPFIQYPQDMVAMQEIIWRVKPDLIIETGIAHGGGLIFYASMLALLENAHDKKLMRKDYVPKRKVIGIDVHIRPQNRKVIQTHFLSNRIQLIEGSSVDPAVIEKVKREAKMYQKILVCLDSNHTSEHVFNELTAYAGLVCKGSYCVVFDTIIEQLSAKTYSNRPWHPGNSPETATRRFLKTNKNFILDKNIFKKIRISVAAKGYLKRVL